MIVLLETAVRRRHFARTLKTIIATSALVAVVSLPGNSMGQSPSCGIEQPAPSCGVESVAPSCGCESPVARPLQAAPIKGPICYRPRSLSFAEKFLKQLDRVGDQLEWEAARNSCSTCSCGASNVSMTFGPSCGCESAAPIPGAAMPSCGCGPNVPTGLPNTMTRNGAGTNPSQPFVNNKGGAGQGGQLNSSVSNGPMFPHKPKETQALGKISDQSATPPKIEKPVAAPVPQVNGSRTEGLIDQGGQTTEPSSTPTSNTERPSADRLPILQPTPTEDSKASTDEKQSPALPPALPQSQDEIPDVLIDPFKDDTSWNGNRNRMNGVQLASGDTPNPLRRKSSVAPGSTPMLLPTPHNEDGELSDELPPVVVKPTVINRFRPSTADDSPKVNRVAVPKKRD
ncbi:MAG: hypothetical protein ACK5PB_19795 [Pirellula sp.]|jgi:hypothetical protein